MDHSKLGPRARRLVSHAAVLTIGLVLATALGPRPASAQLASSGAFRDLGSIETSLQRGVTTQAQVRARWGEPNGAGAARFASLGGDEREIWYYEDIELTGAKSAGGVVKADLRQQILLVIFKGAVVDGYLWTSNAGRASIR
jgi:hypothetical protein